MPEINWGLLQVPDIGGNALAAFERGRQIARQRKTEEAYATYATNPGDENALNALAQFDPKFVLDAKKQQAELQTKAKDEQRKAMLDGVTKIGQAALWADTPEKWDQAVDYLSQFYPDIAKQKGKFTPEARMAAIASAGEMKTKLEQEKGVTVGPGAHLVDPVTGKPKFSAPFAPRPVTLSPGQTAVEYDPNAAKGDPASIWQRMLQTESGGKHFTSNGQVITSPAGAIGIAQVMPGTAPEAARLAGVPFDGQRYRNDPAYNEQLGQAYFQAQLRTFGDPEKAVAAYNAGPGNVQKAVAKGGENWKEYLPNETKGYLNSVFGGGGPRVIGQGGAKQENAPPGYRWKSDGTMEPVPGGPADPGTADMPPPKELAKRNAAYPKVSGAYRTSLQKIDEQIRELEALKESPGLPKIVGAWDSRTPTFLPEATAAQARLKKILARGQFNELQDMRNSSPTGGALGAVSEGENRTLREAAAALDTSQSEADFNAAIDDYLAQLRRSRENITQTFEDTYSYRNSAPAARPAQSAPPQRSAGKPAAKQPTVSNW